MLQFCIVVFVQAETWIPSVLGLVGGATMVTNLACPRTTEFKLRWICWLFKKVTFSTVTSVPWWISTACNSFPNKPWYVKTYTLPQNISIDWSLQQFYYYINMSFSVKKISMVLKLQLHHQFPTSIWVFNTFGYWNNLVVHGWVVRQHTVGACLQVLAFLHAHQFFPCPLKVPVPLMEKLVTCSNTNHVGLLTLPHALTSSGATIVPSTFTAPHWSWWAHTLITYLESILIVWTLSFNELSWYCFFFFPLNSPNYKNGCQLSLLPSDSSAIWVFFNHR